MLSRNRGSGGSDRCVRGGASVCRSPNATKSEGDFMAVGVKL